MAHQKFEVIVLPAELGLRLKFNKHSKTNVAIDYGFGVMKSGILPQPGRRFCHRPLRQDFARLYLVPSICSMLLFGITLLDIINVILVLIFIALGWQYFAPSGRIKSASPELGRRHGQPFLTRPLVRIERTYRDKVRLYTFG